MPESTELTTRDVLGKLNQRLGRVEDDLRSSRDELIEEIRLVRGKLTTRIDRNFRWGIGIVLASWMSLMTTVLLK